MICFHFTIFVVLETTGISPHAARTRLWFAFILLSLSYWKQRNAMQRWWFFCCDLLSFYYLCRTGNNWEPLCHPWASLWFAFILLSLSYWKQRSYVPMSLKSGCDLLSFYYLCRTGNNPLSKIIYPLSVVICFHFTIFVVLETTRYTNLCSKSRLWFAFILLSLSYWKQHRKVIDFLNGSCDLLSFYYLCRTYLCRTGNNCLYEGNSQRSCDLLSFYYLCRTGNNSLIRFIHIV